MRDNTHKIARKKQDQEITVEEVIRTFNVSAPEFTTSFLKTCAKMAVKALFEKDLDCHMSCKVWTNTGAISVCFYNSGKIRHIELLPPTEFGGDINIE